MYYEVWEKYDEKASQYIPLEKLSEFIDTLELPLRIPLPNFYKIILMDIPICENDTVHCVDVLDGLTKNFLGTSEAAGELGDLKRGPERKDYHVVTTTLKRQREIFVVRLIQRNWRSHCAKRRYLLEESENVGNSQTIITIDEVDNEVTESQDDELNAT